MRSDLESSARRDILNANDRNTVPIIVALYHREEQTRQMFAQLDRVTENYSLVLVNNGFDDTEYLRGLEPLDYIENEHNNGAIASVNQGLEVARGDYIAVLHSDLLIYDEGWLDHLVQFMERRNDVGIVGLAGNHCIGEDGHPVTLSTIVAQRGYREFFKPTWKFTEVAAIDGLGWVMRNKGFRLEESYGLMHFYDIDLSMQYIEAGDRVYAAAVDIYHMAENFDRSGRSIAEYLDRIGGDDDAYYDECRERFRKKWEHMLPVWRGGRDEAHLVHDMAESQRLVGEYKRVCAEMRKLEEYVRMLEGDWRQKCEAIAQLDEHCRTLTGELERAWEQLRKGSTDE